MNSLIFFFIGILSSQKISLFGEIYIGEILCGIVILSNLKSIRLPENTKTTFGLLFVWFLAQLVADIVNQTEAIKAVKGILVPVFVTIIILGLNTAFYNRYKYLPLYLFGVFVGLWLNKIVSGSTYYEYNSWKWGLGTSVALCFFTWIEFYCKRNKATYLLVGCAIFVVICLANSARIMAALILMASIISVFANSIVKMNIYRHLSCSPYGFLQFLFVLIITLFIIDWSMAALFTFEPFLDLLSPLDAWKFSLQAESKWGMILGGRTELLISLEAFFDSPLLGHGSWAENPYYVYSHLAKMDAAGGMLRELDVVEQNINSFLIPTHSYLMGAMVWGGFFAGLFWLKIIGLSISGLLSERVISSPLLLYIIISLIWNILFSPFGADARWLSTVLLWVYMHMTNISSFKKD